MRTVILLGNPNTKRTIYFEKAARQNGLAFSLLEWDVWKQQGFPRNQEVYLKIDPPVWRDSGLSRLNSLVSDYQRDLNALEQEASIVHYLNPPQHIRALLDKKACKQKLKQAAIPVTEAWETDMTDSRQLLSFMEENHIFQVFIKPVSGSGAAGVAALRFQPASGRMAVYSCAALDHRISPPALVNTKQLRVLTEPSQVCLLVDRLLSLGCIIERWYPKAEHHGWTYDLRAVCQDGQLDFLLARLSKGPITNLHLNNHPLDVSCLGLSGQLMDSIASLCRNACGCYPGLRSAGIDILLEKGNLTPRIIEMNSQGDLIYQDIYNTNQIYSHQTLMMKRWLELV